MSQIKFTMNCLYWLKCLFYISMTPKMWSDIRSNYLLFLLMKVKNMNIHLFLLKDVIKYLVEARQNFWCKTSLNRTEEDNLTLFFLTLIVKVFNSQQITLLSVLHIFPLYFALYVFKYYVLLCFFIWLDVFPCVLNPLIPIFPNVFVWHILQQNAFSPVFPEIHKDISG